MEIYLSKDCVPTIPLQTDRPTGIESAVKGILESLKDPCMNALKHDPGCSEQADSAGYPTLRDAAKAGYEEAMPAIPKQLLNSANGHVDGSKVDVGHVGGSICQARDGAYHPGTMQTDLFVPQPGQSIAGWIQDDCVKNNQKMVGAYIVTPNDSVTVVTFAKED